MLHLILRPPADPNLCNLQQYDKAEEAMEQVLKLDAKCKDATYDLYNCKLQQLLVNELSCDWLAHM